MMLQDFDAIFCIFAVILPQNPLNGDSLPAVVVFLDNLTTKRSAHYAHQN